MSRSAIERNREIQSLAQETNATFAITTILHLGAMVTEEAAICEPLVEFIEELDSTVAKDLDGKLDFSRVFSVLDDEDKLREFCCDCLDHRAFGFLCQVEAPDVVWNPDRRSARIRYGLRHSRWFYDEDLPGILKQAEQWALSLEKTAKKGGAA